ncbi:MAG: hypothetical protein H7Y01_01595 [Ferruginibacter sp.]|nr:hypothetical protein [Chitinophagaceae bacterium]
MRYFGVLSAVLLYILLFVFSALFNTSLFVNNAPFWLNLSVLLIVCIAFYFLAMPYYKTSPASVRMVYFLATVVTIHCSCNLAGYVLKGDPPALAKDDWSGLVIAPVIFAIAIIWGWVFDWKKNKIAKLNAANE